MNEKNLQSNLERLGRQKIEHLYPKYKDLLHLTVSHPIQLPLGWRLPYEMSLQARRVRRSLLVLYIDQSLIKKSPSDNDFHHVEVEYDSFVENELVEKLEGINFQNLIDKLPNLPSVDRVRQKLQEQFNNITIQNLEAVIDPQPSGEDISGKVQPTIDFWRVKFETLDEHIRYRKIALVGYRGSETDVYHTRNQRQRDTTGSRYGLFELFDVGSIKLSMHHHQINRLSINTNKTRMRRLRARMMTEVVFSIMIEFMDLMGFAFHNAEQISFRYSSVSNFKTHVANATLDGPVPEVELQFSEEQGISWADDPTIICHELGHAIRYLLYVQPTKVRNVLGNDLFDGIEEGFCDYFTVVILCYSPYTDTNNNRIEIGGALSQSIQHDHNSLPRALDVKPAKPSSNVALRYRIGMMWAHLLWDVRMHLVEAGNTALQVDTAIITAHFKFHGNPNMLDEVPENMYIAHYESIRWTVDAMKLSHNIESTTWEEIYIQHNLEGLIGV